MLQFLDASLEEQSLERVEHRVDAILHAVDEAEQSSQMWNSVLVDQRAAFSEQRLLDASDEHAHSRVDSARVALELEVTVGAVGLVVERLLGVHEVVANATGRQLLSALRLEELLERVHVRCLEEVAVDAQPLGASAGRRA